MRGIHRWPVNSLHKRPVTRKIFPFDDVTMVYLTIVWWQLDGCNGGGKCVSLYWLRSGTWDSKHVLVPHLRRLSSNLVTATVANNHHTGNRPSCRLLKVRLKLVIEKPFIYSFYLFLQNLTLTIGGIGCLLSFWCFIHDLQLSQLDWAICNTLLPWIVL